MLATTRAVARRARQPIPIGRNGSFTPLVIRPDDIPKITDREAARAMPELAVLSVVTHRRAEFAQRAAIGLAALIGTDQAALDDLERELYLDVILRWLGDRVLRTVERKMDLDNYKYQSKPMKRAFAKGHAEGHAEGRTEERRELLRALVERKFGPLSPEHIAVLEQADYPTLGQLLDRALTADTLPAVFGPSPP